MTQLDSLRGIVGRILLNDWDPIGIRGVAQAQDEYDQYVMPVARMIVAGETAQRYVTLRNSKEGLKKYAGGHTEDAFAIRAMLNQYEMIAIGISRGILDEDMFRTYHRGTAVRDWMAAVQFVDEERKENDRYWIEFQHLAEKLQNAP